MNYIETLIKAQKELEQIAVKGEDVFHMGNALVAISQTVEAMAKEAKENEANEAVVESSGDQSN